MHGHQGPVNCVAFSRDGDLICSGGADTTLMVWKNNLSGVGYPKKSKFPEDEGLSKPVTIPKKRAKSRTGLKCCKDMKNKMNKSASMNKFKKEENKSNYRNKNLKSNTINAKIPVPKSQQNINIYSANLNNNTIKSNGIQLSNTNQSSKNPFAAIPPEMKVTFEKMISQLDLIAKTMKIFDQRTQSLEGQISTLYNRRKKGFVKKQPPQMGDYQYLLENSNNFFPDNSINNNIVSQQLNNNNNRNDFNYNTANVYQSNPDFKDSININDENKKNVFKTEIDINQINKNASNQIDNDKNIDKGHIEEEYEYNGEEQVIEGDGDENGDNEEEIDNNQFNQENQNEQEYEEEQREEYQEGEEYQGQTEDYVNEEEFEQEQGNEEEQVDYDYKNDEKNENNEINIDENKPK